MMENEYPFPECVEVDGICWACEWYDYENPLACEDYHSEITGSEG